MKKLLLILLLALVACGPQAKKSEKTFGPNKELNKVFDDYYEERLKYFPLEATGIGDNRYNDQLPVDIADSYREQLKSFFQKYLDETNKFNRDSLAGEDILSYDMFKREMQMQIEGLGFHDNLMPINQFWSMPLTFGQLGSGEGNQPFKTTKDYNDFLSRINGFVAYTDTAIANMKRGLAQHITPPKILMERVLPQLKAMDVKEITTSVFYGPIKKLPASFDAKEKARLTEAYTKAITGQIIPAYMKLYNFIKDEYMPKCRTTNGISDIPGGKEYYAYQARFWTTTLLSPDEIYDIGQKEVARLRSEMEKVKNEVGFKGDLKSFFNYIHTDAKFMPFKQDSDVINAYNEINKREEPQLKKLFSLVPKTKFEIRQTEEFREASASAEYNQGAADGSRPGIFYVPVIDPAKYSNVSMEDLFLHEAIPGHHYQTSIQQENTELPKFRRFGWYGAYGEGWALYCESLGKELGLYTDPYQYFGSLSAEMHRAIRLVVDVGMHTKGMTREEAIQFSLNNEAEGEADVISEIERYMSIPGQALGYKIGQMKIIEIRKRAEQALGTKFNIANFHDEVLKGGCLPLDVFENKMNEWIKAQQ